MNTSHYPVTCTGCGTWYPISHAELQAALSARVERFYCLSCSAWLPDTAAWPASERERQREETP